MKITTLKQALWKHVKCTDDVVRQLTLIDGERSEHRIKSDLARGGFFTWRIDTNEAEELFLGGTIEEGK